MNGKNSHAGIVNLIIKYMPGALDSIAIIARD